MRLIAGRDFDEADRAGGTGAVVVNEAMARAYWPGESALGKCLIRGKRTNPCSTVVGIVGNVHRMRVVETPGSHYYVPLDPASLGSTPAALVVRTTSRNVAAVSQVATQELKNLLPGTTTPWIRTMSQTLESQYRPWRLGATLFTAFGALALVVAAIGVYSVVAYGVSQRTHEMGVRVALGAQPYDVLRLVLGEGERIVALGVALGVVIALVLGRLVASLLYGVTARDPLVMITAAAVLLTVGLVASVLPGWRATRVDPVAALRAE
jgi:ABC-type lipoprotein release transport system permease subunit